MASMESSLLFILERGLGIVLQAMQEKKALHLARTGASQGFPRAAAPVGVFSQRAPPRYAQGDLTSLAPHERLPEIPVVPREKPHTGAAARENPRDAPVIVR